MTTLEPARTLPAPRRVSRLPRPYTIFTTGGVTGVMTLAGRLCDMGYRMPDFSVDIHEGVGCTGVRCTIALTHDECSDFADIVRSLPGVLSVEPS